MNKKRNAFTLIELLAIIVILAIIAVITVPIILNIIENSRKGAATDSAYGYKDSVNKTYIAELSKPNLGGLKLNGTYEVQDDGTLKAADTYDFGVSGYEKLPVVVSGDKPSSGKLRYSNNVLNAGCVVIGDYKVTFDTNGKVDETVKGDCSDYNFSALSGNSGQDDSENGETISYFNNERDNYVVIKYDEEDPENYWYSEIDREDLKENDKIYLSTHEFSNGKAMICTWDGKAEPLVCIEPNKWDCEAIDTGEVDQYDNPIYTCSNSTGYIASKIEEFEQNGFSITFSSSSGFAVDHDTAGYLALDDNGEINGSIYGTRCYANFHDNREHAGCDI